MTDEKFIECVGLLQASFGAAQNERLAALKLSLVDFTDQEIELATGRVLRLFRPTATNPFPVPADFIEAARGGLEDEAIAYMSAISKIISKHGAYKSVDFGSDAVHDTIDRFGGWVAVCGWSQEEWNINEGRFMAVLKSSLKFNGKNQTRYLCGVFEKTNGFLRQSDLISLSVSPLKLEYVKPRIMFENKKELQFDNFGVKIKGM